MYQFRMICFMVFVVTMPNLLFAEQKPSVIELLSQGEKILKEGYLSKALFLFQSAYEQTKQENNKEKKVAVMAALGESYYRAQKFKKAEQWLVKSYRLAVSLNNPRLLGAVAIRLGNVSLGQSKISLAHKWYQKVLQSNDKALIVAAHINTARVESSIENNKKNLLDAYQILEENPSIKQAPQLLVSLGYQASQNNQIHLAYNAFQKALTLAETARIKSQALGYLAKLYFIQHKYDDALLLLDRAIYTDESPDLLMNWIGQKADILHLQGDKKNALKAYRQSVDYLLAIKSDIPILYQGGKSIFQQSLSPLYIGLIDLLLQEASTEQIKPREQSLLLEAQNIWEKFKAAEMQDYFRNSCVVNQNANEIWNKIEANTAVIYPILLPERMEILVRYDEIIEQYTIPVGSENIKNLVKTLLINLKQGNQISRNKQLYDLLIKPIQQLLDDNNITTLVYLPDGPLRQIPLGMLTNGNQFLIEKYAIVTGPGLSMLNVKAKKKNNANILLVGMSEPGPVIDELIALKNSSLLEDFSEMDEILLADQKSRGLDSKKKDKEVELGLSKNKLRSQRYKDVLALPSVTNELNNISELMDYKKLENEEFTLEGFGTEIVKGFSIVHIATHGIFSGDPDKSFVMTYDHLLKMKALATLFQTEVFSENPVDLVSLSACSTAEGDDRSPLGLSGVVVQMGVKSVIGSLWTVADQAAQILFTEFYQMYSQSEINKANALRLAKLKLMQNKSFSNPLFWAPFILIGQP